jgi:Flp pilus assembly protein TadG
VSGIRSMFQPASQKPHNRCSELLRRCRELRSDSGGALVELALVLALFGLPMLCGIADLGVVIYASIEVSNAAHSGALYGMTSSTYASDTSGITTAAQTEAADFGTNLSVTPTAYYVCSSAEGGTQYTTQSAATSACTGSGNHPLEMIKVVVSATVKPPIHLPALPATFTQTGTSVMEVEE